MEISKHKVGNRNEESTIQIVCLILGCQCVVCFLLTNNEIVKTKLEQIPDGITKIEIHY